MKTNWQIKNISLDWKETKLVDIGIFSKGSGISKSELSVKGYNAIRYGEIYTRHNVYVKEIYSFISNEVVKNTKKIKYGDILFAGSGETIDEIGKSVTYLKKDDCYAGGDIIIFSPKKQNSLFLAFLLNSRTIRKDLRKLGQGQSVVHIYKKDLEKIKLLLPPLSEQNRIVAILEIWDEYLEKLSRKIEIKKDIKKGLMQRLLTGKVRLDGFSGEWESVKFSDCMRVLGKIKGEKKSDYLEKGKFPIIDQSQNKIAGYSNRNDFVNKNFPVIIFGDHTRILKYIDFLFILGNDGTKILKEKKDNDIKYLYYYLYSIDIPNTGYNRHFKYIKDLNFEIPNPKEQTAIAKILTMADEEIEALEKKKKIVEKQKKYLLNNLITGKIRV